MKTIEERADYWANNAQLTVDTLFGIKQETLDERDKIIAKQSYLKGATEQLEIDEEEGDLAQQENILKALERQKKIDIEKAGLNFCVFCSSYDNCDARYSCETFEKFCKAMEE